MRRVWAFTAMALAGGCAHYTPAPIDAAAVAHSLEHRELRSPDLAHFLTAHGSEGPGRVWSVTDFVLAALFYSPQLDRLRAEWRAAQAAAITAGARERPDVEGELGYGVTGTSGVESRWLAALAAVFTVELGGKRGARIAAARARAARAEVELENATWEIDAAVRAAFQEFSGIWQEGQSIQHELELRNALVAAARGRYARGELRRTELATLEAGGLEVRAEATELKGREFVAQVRLVSVIGSSPTTLADSYNFGGPEDCGPMDDVDAIRRAAVHARPDVARALADYAVAEADVRLAVSGSYPDLRLGPGFTWDQGVGRWSLLFALPRLAIKGNRGPIAEALNRRSAAASAVAEAEWRVMSDVAEAFEACLGARREVSESREAIKAAEQQLAAVREAFNRGEVGAEDTLAARLPLLRARVIGARVQQRLTMAAIEYQRAQGNWAGGAIRRPDPRQAPERKEDTP